MSIEAMRQAVEALDEAANVLTSPMFADAAAALREAIEQAEKQEPVALPCCSYTDASAIKWNPLNGVVQCHNCGQTYIPPAAQEPVAWLYVNADMPTNRQLEWTEARQGYAGNWLKYPLYTAPRQWVGLTNEEIEAVMQGSVEGERMLPYQFARAIEAKLKAKNETS
jgi:hypothetical protein